MKEIITFSDYQSRSRNIKTPEDAARFAQELQVCPVLRDLVDEVRTAIKSQGDAFRIPDFKN